MQHPFLTSLSICAHMTYPRTSIQATNKLKMASEEDVENYEMDENKNM